MAVFCRHVECAGKPAHKSMEAGIEHERKVHMIPRMEAPLYLIRV